MPSECDDYAFIKVCDDSFFVAHGGGNDVIVTVSVLIVEKNISLAWLLGPESELMFPDSRIASNSCRGGG